MSDNLTESLIGTLLEEKKIYDRMVSVSADMKAAVIGGDTGGLSDMIKEETDLAEQAADLEKRRIAVSDGLWKRLGGEKEGGSLAALCESVEDPAARDRLVRLRAEMSATLKRLMRLNRANKALLAQKKRYARAMLGALLQTEQAGCFYDSSGSAGVYSPGAGLIDRQA